MDYRSLIFDLGAMPYDHMTRHAYWRQHCREMVDAFPEPTGDDARRLVLDLGCGPGVSALAFKDVAPDDQVVGVDISGPMVRRALRNDTSRRCSWLKGDALRLPFPNGLADVVTGHSFLYLIPDRRGALRDIARVLRPGGCLVLLEPRRQGFVGDTRSVGRILRTVGPQFALTMGMWRIVAAASGAFPEGALQELLGEEGFTDVRTTPTIEGLGWMVEATRP
jgi:ubiquinone/menaquinone biosynthesis C-methylase UbiE